MAALTKFQQFVEDLAFGVHDLSGDTLKAYLTNSAPDAAADAVLADLPAEIAAGNGYSAGGMTLDIASAGQTGGTFKLVLTDEVLTASGGTIGPFRYVVVYNSTPAGGPLIGYSDYGSSITLADTETFTLDFDASNGVVQLV
jgi:hypothetical protein